MAKSVAERHEIVERYLGLVASGTAAQIMELYAAEPTLEDPVGSAPRVGRAAVEEFYESIQDLETETTLREFHGSGDNAAAFAFDVVTKTGDLSVAVSAIEVMEFDDAGKITHMRAYWHADTDMTMS
ncbi:nuclear transport factor 2 family protein [Nocardioides daejeonensis]|uniref:nuclear transport factor 2 family protein n=1 Tax=Nocardioides daejeonensis TaxID=1046556 RepID=UPI000D74E388|nr:nuclear transport factor 2 family protein [Nocardioides daejeonensis]